MSIGTTCKNWLEWAVPVACRASQAFWPAIFFTVGPINCGQRRRCRIHFASSCALQYHGVFVLQVCEASQNGHAKMEGQVLRVATHLDTSHLPCHSYVSLPLSRHVPRLPNSPPESHLRDLVAKPQRYCARVTFSLAIPAECHEKPPGPALSGVRHDAEPAWS